MEEPTPETVDKIARITLILDNICPECHLKEDIENNTLKRLILSESKKSSTCPKCGASYDLEAIKLAGCHKIS